MKEEKKDVEVIEDDEIVTLTDEEGNNRDFFVLAELDYEGKWYIYLEPCEPIDDFKEGEIIIFELGENEDGETFKPVKDEKTLQAVFDLFLKQVETGDSE